MKKPPLEPEVGGLVSKAEDLDSEKSLEPKPPDIITLNTFSWNANSIRNAVKNMSEEQKLIFLGQDILFLQETRLGSATFADVPLNLEDWHIFTSDFPVEEGSVKGKGYSGVATLIKKKIFNQITSDDFVTIREIPGLSLADSEGRYLEVRSGKLSLINMYFPSASRGRDERIPYKNEVQTRIYLHIVKLQKQGCKIILGADFHVCPRTHRYSP